jgi:hypothetical protein
LNEHRPDSPPDPPGTQARGILDRWREAERRLAAGGGDSELLAADVERWRREYQRVAVPGDEPDESIVLARGPDRQRNEL